MTYISMILEPKDHERAVNQGRHRRQTCIQQNKIQRNNFVGTEDTKLKNDIVGAIGELCVAKYLGMEHLVFEELDEYRGSVDLPPNIDIKNTNGHGRRLIIYLNDNPGKIFVSCTYEEPETRIHGWCFGHEMMTKQFIDDPQGTNRPAYFIRQAYLRPMAELRSYLLSLGFAK